MRNLMFLAILSIALGWSDRLDAHGSNSTSNKTTESQQQMKMAAGLHMAAGIVVMVDKARGVLVIDHGPIEGLMGAMTMGFNVADPALLEKATAGDKVEFMLRAKDMTVMDISMAIASKVKMMPGKMPAKAGVQDHSSHSHMHAKSHGQGTSDTVACTAPVAFAKEAELKPGGALYDGPLPKEAMTKMTGSNADDHSGHANMAGMAPAKSAKSMKEMDGAHAMHKGRRGGEMLMVANQLHHLEVVYGKDCGFQLFFYNAFTQPIRPDRFQAVVLVQPEDDDDSAFETLRILTMSEDGSHLTTPALGGPMGKEREIYIGELYVKTPESFHPVQVDVIFGAEVTWN
ncbi:MAG: copper-binding protein [Rhodospirillaceae bacterium]|nr:copper-binding protein [Rhodospirillaceae bacterium]